MTFYFVAAYFLIKVWLLLVLVYNNIGKYKGELYIWQIV